MVKIIPDDKCKANIHSLFCDGTYYFMDHVKTTELEQFLDPEKLYIDNF